MAVGDLTAEDQGEDAADHVLVDAAEGARLDVKAGLFADLAAQAVLDRLGEFENAAGGLPVLVVAPLDEQSFTVAVGDDATDADGMTGIHRIAWVPIRRQST